MSEWNSVKEALPAANQRVIAVVSLGVDRFLVLVRYCPDRKPVWPEKRDVYCPWVADSGHAYPFNAVTNWMPEPELP